MPHTSPFGRLDLKETDVFSFLFDQPEKSFDDEQVIFQDSDVEWRNYTYAQLQKSAHEFGRGLKWNHEIKKGDVVAVFSGNDIDFAPVVFGALWAGACVSPANPGFTASELTHQLKDAKAKVLVTQLSLIKTARQAACAAGIPESNVLIMGARKDMTRTYKHWSSMGFLVTGREVKAPTICPKNDLAFLVYRQNSSGTPRGVRLTHHNLTSSVETLHATEHAPLDLDTDSVLSHVPTHNVYGLTHIVHAPVYHGLKTVVMPQFGIEKWCSAAQQHKPTVAYIEPSTAHLLQKHSAVDDYDLSSIRMAVAGASPLCKELIMAVHARTGIPIKQAYGLCEASPTAFAQRWEDWNTAVGSSGVLLPNMEAKFCVNDTPALSATAQEVPAGEIGELFIRGPSVFAQIHRDEVATSGVIDADGWLRTGNVGYIDDAGHIFLTNKVAPAVLKSRIFRPSPHNTLIQDHELLDGAAVMGLTKTIAGDVYRGVATAGVGGVVRYHWVF